MPEILRDDTLTQLFTTVLQHMKCIEVRLDYARVATSQKQRYVLGNAVNKVQGAINHICDLLPDSTAILKVKKELDDPKLVYLMIFTEQLMRAEPGDMEDLVEIIEKHLDEKYGKTE